MLKKDKLRYNEYFDMQSIFDELYQQSRNNSNIVIVSKAVIPLIEDKNADYCSNLSEKQKVKLNRLRRARKLKPVKGTCKLA